METTVLFKVEYGALLHALGEKMRFNMEKKRAYEKALRKHDSIDHSLLDDEADAKLTSIARSPERRRTELKDKCIFYETKENMYRFMIDHLVQEPTFLLTEHELVKFGLV